MPDYEPRGRVDIDRGSNLFRQRIQQQRVESTRFPGNVAREDTEAEFTRRQVHAQTPRLEKLAKLAVVAGGVGLAGRAIGRQRLMKVISETGNWGRNLNYKVFKPVRHLVDDIVLGHTPTAKSLSRRYMGASGGLPSRTDPDIVQELQLMYSKYNATGDDSIKWLHGKNLTGVDLHRRYLAERYSGRLAPDGLHHVTVNELLNSSNIKRRFSSNAIKVLEKAKAHGVITGNMSLSSSDTFGLFKDASGELIDSQWMSPQRLFDSAHKLLRNFTIGSLKPADLIFGAIRPALFQARHATIGGNITLPNGIKTGRGLNFSLGGNVYTQIEGQARFELAAEGLRIYDVSRPGSHFWARSIAAMEGRIGKSMQAGLQTRFADRNLNPIRHFFQRFQDTVGFGPEFATNRSVFGEAVDAFYRHGIDRNSKSAPGVFVSNKFVPRDSLLNVRQRARARAAFDRGTITGYDTIDDYLEEAVVNPHYGKGVENLPALERFKALFGMSRAGSHYRDPPGVGWHGIKIGDVKNPRKPMQGYAPIGMDSTLKVGPGGVPAMSVPATGMADSAGKWNSFNVFMHHATERLNQLIGATTGMGIRPTAGRLGWIGNLGKIYGMAATGSMTLEYAKYIDYLAGQTMDFIPGIDDTTPSQYAVKAYGGAMVLRQKLREATGIQQLAAYSEGLMPGSMSLPASYLLRTAAPIVGGGYLGGKKGAALGGLITGLIGGKDVGMSSQELSDIYSGRKKIPVMKSRWWVMGQQPFEGNEISYYRHHWAARYSSNFRYTDTQYGSKAEYFAFQSSAPTPHNLFGLLKLTNPDYFAEKHYYNRPYPYSPSGDRMHPGEDYILPPSDASYDARALGYEGSAGSYILGDNPGTAYGLAARGLNYVTELGGIYKFFAEQLPFYEDVFGSGRNSSVYAAQAGTITSGSREFYDESLGGMLGYTELLRRFLDPDQGRQGINYIPNQMPSWLPGARSEFMGDRDYFTDFTLGDPYARVAMGEARLPGQAYEQLHRLHSGTPGVYDAMDRYRILADVAPYSESFKHYRAIVQGWIASGALDKSWYEEYQTVESQVSSILDGPEFSARRFTGVRSGTLEQLATVNQYSLPERVIGGAWETLTHDVIPTIGRTVPLFGTILDRKLLGQRSAYESYLEDQVYGTDFHDWSTPYSSFVRPRINNLIASDPVTAFAGGAGIGTLFGLTPFGATVGSLSALTLGGMSLARMGFTGDIRGGWTPSHFDEINQNEQYFDSLRYERAMRNMSLAEELGRTDLAGKYKSIAQRTSVGIRYDQGDNSFIQSAKFRLGTPMKDYAWQFLQAPPESRQAIMSVAGNMAAPILASSWNRLGDKRFPYRPDSSAGDASSDIIAHYGMPSSGWAGWSPDIPMETIKIKTMENVFNWASDMHRYNIWESDMLQSTRSYPNITSAY